jgi:hypothetical protein
MLVNATVGNSNAVLKLKRLVYRSSRTVGGATTPPAVPLSPG